METLLNIDESIFSFVNRSMSSDILDFILIPFRQKLFWIPVYLFLISFIYLNFRSNRWVIFLALFACIAISDYSSSSLIKKNVQRLRPCHIEHLNAIEKVPCSNGYSFTSSHATNHFAISGFFFFLFSFWKRNWIFLAWAGIIAFAQVYVGLHYPTDVLAGSLLGFFIGWLIFIIYNKFKITN